MRLEGEQVLLRVACRNTDSYRLGSLAEAVAHRAKQAGLAGATVLEGLYGTDVNCQLLARRRWSLVQHFPVVIEMVDGAAAIGGFLPVVLGMLGEGLVTLERAHVLAYRHSKAQQDRVSGRLSLPGGIEPLSTLPSSSECPAMQNSEEGKLLRIFIGENDQFDGKPLYKAIVARAMELGVCGATVFRGSLGFGAHSTLHSASLVDVGSDLPLVVEIVDASDKIESLLPFLDEVVAEGLVTTEDVRMIRLRRKEA
jgi:PII-like signaling protein